MNRVMTLSFLIFTLFAVLIAWHYSKNSKPNSLNGLFLANRNLNFLLVGFGLLFTNINTASIVGENELSYTNNMTVMAWGISSVFAMLLVSELIIPMYLKLGIATTPDFLTARYGSGVGKIVSVIFLISYIVNLLPSVLYGGAVAFNGMFNFSSTWNMDYWTTVWILVWVMGSIGGLCSLLGGLRAITVLDTLFGFGFFAGGLLLPVFGLKYVGGGDIVKGLHLVLTTHTNHLNSIGSSKDPVPFTTIFTGMFLVNLYYWGTEQYIVQQVLGSKDLKSCQKGIAVACFGKLISPLLLNVPGLIAVHVFSKMHNPTEAFSKLDGLVSPPILAGFIAAIIFGAGMTTFNAGLNSSSTLFVLNLYQPWKVKRCGAVTESSLVRTAKRFEIVVCLAAMFIAPFIFFAKNGFYTYIQTVNGFFNVPIFTIMFMGFVTKRVPALAAKVGLFFFILMYALTQTMFNLHLHFLHILAILFVLTCIIMYTIGKLKPMDTPYQLKLNNVVSIEPWKNRYLVGGVLVALMVLMFVLFSPAILSK